MAHGNRGRLGAVLAVLGITALCGIRCFGNRLAAVERHQSRHGFARNRTAQAVARRRTETALESFGARRKSCHCFRCQRARLWHGLERRAGICLGSGRGKRQRGMGNSHCQRYSVGCRAGRLWTSRHTNIDGSKIYALGVEGTLVCLNVADGKEVWKQDLVKDYGGKIPTWGYSESPLVDGEKVIVTPGNMRLPLWLRLPKAPAVFYGKPKFPEGDPAHIMLRP